MPMRFHIVGMGAIGCLVSFHLRRTLDLRHSVTVIHKLAKQVKEAKRAGNSVQLENNGVVLSASGFRHQGYDREPESTGAKSLSEESDRSRPRSKERPQFSPGSAPEVFFRGLKQSMMDLFHPRADGLLRTGKFWSGGRLARWHTRRKSRRNERATTLPLEPIDSLFVCVKAQSTLQTIRGLLPRLTPNSTIVLLQNGMGVYEELVTQLFPNPLQRPHIICSVITHGAWIKKYMHVVHAGIGKIDIGVMPDGQKRDFEASYNGQEHEGFFSPVRLNLDDIAKRTPDFDNDRYRTLRETVEVLIGLEPLQVSWLPVYDVQMAMRRKVVVNAVINPITALLDCKNGRIFTHPEGRHLCRAICREAEAVFRAQWEQERKNAEAGEGDDGARFPAILQAEQLEKVCMDVANTTAQNVSSMLADVRLGRPTEIQYVTGYLIGLGKKHGVRTPTNLAMYNIIRLRTSLQLADSPPSVT